jgi:hypothetical protein
VVLKVIKQKLEFVTGARKRVIRKIVGNSRHGRTMIDETRTCKPSTISSEISY